MKDKIKTILEVIIVPIAITYLIYLLCSNVEGTTSIVFLVFAVLTSLELLIKSMKYIFSYGPTIISKILSGIFAIFNVIFLFLIYWTNYQTVGMYEQYAFYIALVIFLVYLIARTIICLYRIVKEKGKLYTNVTTSFICFLSFLVITTTSIILYLKG